jgi:hypothetical protein
MILYVHCVRSPLLADMGWSWPVVPRAARIETIPAFVRVVAPSDPTIGAILVADAWLAGWLTQHA